MSNDNNQNENIKNDKFSLYIEKINPKKPKKKQHPKAVGTLTSLQPLSPPL